MQAALTLFDFDFSEEKTVKDYEKMFTEILEISKQKGNPYCLSREYLPPHIGMMDIFEMEKLGFLKTWKDYLEISDDKLFYHTLDEALAIFEKKMAKACNKENVCWYKDVISVSHGTGISRWQSKELSNAFYLEKEKIVRRYAEQFGLKHFKEVPSSRGIKIRSFSSWEKENVLPVISKFVLATDNYDEIKGYFRGSSFFMGFNRGGYLPYPDFKSFIPTTFDIVCLSEAKTEKDVTLIFEYIGCSMGGVLCVINNISKDKKYLAGKKIIYPEGWSWERYIETLTDEDKENIKADLQRLNRLHNEEKAYPLLWEI